MFITKEDIQRTVEQVPGLTQVGIERPQGASYESNLKSLLDSATAVNRICEWLERVEASPRICRRYSSYNLKHAAEGDLGHIRNGEFIVAAILCGFVYEVPARGQNVYFGMNRRSIESAICDNRNLC